jgi:hypothetical protein
MICVDCVAPAPLKKLFLAHGTSGDCEYCGRHGRTMDTKQLFAYVYDRVSENVAVREDLSDFELNMLYEGGSDSIPVADIDIVLADWFELCGEPYFADLCDGVPPEFRKDDAGETKDFYSDDGTLERNLYQARWDKFVDGVHYHHRYFNPDAAQFLDSIFSLLVTDSDQLRVEVVRTIRPGDLLFRARHVSNREQAEVIVRDPAQQFGPTPKHLASSQRMTPSGISALYCALERETCLSEIRSITGDHVVSAALTPISNLQLLDLTVLNRVEHPTLTLLDEGFREARHRKVFLGSLVKKMSRPKARDDELSYLSTQVVFEYLRLRFGQYVDGVVFPSVQTGEVGTNVVIFPEAGRLSYMPLAESHPDDELAPVAVPPENPFGPPAKLSVVADSIRFHRVTAIETRAQEYLHFYPLFMNDVDRKRLGPYFE